MPDTSPRLDLPLIQPSQAQKHVTHNDALVRLDALVQLVLEGVDALAPPPNPSEGEVWALGAIPTGAWDGHSNKIAAWQNGGWLFLTPQEGWQGWDKANALYSVYTGGVWINAAATSGTASFQNVTGLGIGTTFDALNRLSVSADATLLSHAGTGHQLKLNKSGANDTASLLFQTGYSGRAEMGSIGSDDFEIKVSADGISFSTGLRLKAASGIAEVKALSGAPLQIADDSAVFVPCPTTAGFVLLTVAGNDPRSDVSAMLVQDSGSSPALQSLFATALVEVLGTTVLSGTSASDGSLGVSSVTGGLWIENRLGAAQSISITFLGGL